MPPCEVLERQRRVDVREEEGARAHHEAVHVRVDVRQERVAGPVAGLDEHGEDGDQDEENRRRGRVEKADEEGERAAADGEEADPDCGGEGESEMRRLEGESERRTHTSWRRGHAARQSGGTGRRP